MSVAVKFSTAELTKVEGWVVNQINKNQSAIRDMMVLKAPSYVIQNLRDENWALGLLLAKITREWSEKERTQADVFGSKLNADAITVDKIEPGAGDE